MHDYDGFISYSHSADGQLAPALQSCLHRFAKPWYRMRALRTFRDTTNLSVSPGLWDSIAAALADANYFLLLASPRAAQSKWVQREVDYWLTNREHDHLLIVLTEGELRWSEEQVDFDWSITDAVPRQLAGRFTDQPLYLDLRWARDDTDLSLHNPRFLDAIAQIAAPMHGRSKDELVGEDVRQHKRTRVVVRSVGLALAGLTLASLLAAGFAYQQKRLADDRLMQATEAQRSAESRLLSSQATRFMYQDDALLTRATLLAMESLRLQGGDGAANVLRAGLARLARPLAILKVNPQDTTLHSADRRLTVELDNGRSVFAGGSKWSVNAHWDGKLLATVRSITWGAEPCGRHPEWLETDISYADKVLRITDTRTGQTLHASHDGAITGCAISPNGDRLVTVSGDIARELPPVPIPGDQTLRVWDIRPTLYALGQEQAPRPYLISTDFSTDGRFAAAGFNNAPAVRVFDLADAVQIATLPVERHATVVDVMFSPDTGYLVALPIYATQGYLWSTKDWQEHAVLDQNISEGGVDFSADARVLAVDYGGLNSSGDATYWDVATGHKIPELVSRSNVTGTHVKFLAGGTGLVKFSFRRPAEIWDVATRRPVGKIGPVDARGGLVSPDGKRIAFHDYSDTVTIWSIDAGERELTLRTQQGGAVPKAFSPDGKLLAIAGEGGSLSIWDLQTQEPVHTLAYTETIGGVAFSDDGRLLAAATYAYGGSEVNAFRVSNVADIYDTGSWQRLARLSHQGLVSAVEFSADNRYLRADVHLSEESGMAPGHLWLWQAEDLITAACARLTRNMTADEWAEFMPSQPYRETCPNLPVAVTVDGSHGRM